jgi:hypothetical protein
MSRTESNKNMIPDFKKHEAEAIETSQLEATTKKGNFHVGISLVSFPEIPNCPRQTGMNELIGYIEFDGYSFEIDQFHPVNDKVQSYALMDYLSVKKTTFVNVPGLEEFYNQAWDKEMARVKKIDDKTDLSEKTIGL